MKVEMLGVARETLDSFGAVSQETAEAMAIGARRRTGSTYALSVTGAAGPEPPRTRPGRPSPWGPCTSASPTPPASASTHRVLFGDRQRIRVFAAQMALDLLRRRMLGLA